MSAVNPVSGIGSTWAMVQDHGYTPGALILFVLVVLAYALGTLAVVALAVHIGKHFATGVRTGYRRSQGSAE